MRLCAPLALAFAVLAAGCLSDGSISTSTPPTSPSASGTTGAPASVTKTSASSSNASSAAPLKPLVRVYWENGTVTADQGVVLGATSTTTGSPEFPVDKGAKRIVAKLAWSGGAGSLQAALLSPSYCNGASDATTNLQCAASIEAGGSDAGEFKDANATATGGASPSMVTLDAAAIAKANACGGAAECTWDAAWHADPAIVGATFSYRVEVDY
ncbi:MAG: hypothetical protein ACYDCK_09155 [Thermoplasmatota archaeon]